MHIKSKSVGLVVTLGVLLLCSSCTFMYVPLIPANPQMRDARFLLSDSKGLSLEEEQLRLDVTITEIPKSDWLAVQWFNPLSKEIASDSKWLEVPDASSSESKEISFILPKDIAVTPGYWRAVISYQGRLIRQFGFDYALAEEVEESSNLNEDASSETNTEEISNEPSENKGN